jgi:hypothetical protein
MKCETLIHVNEAQRGRHTAVGRQGALIAPNAEHEAELVNKRRHNHLFSASLVKSAALHRNRRIRKLSPPYHL